MRPAGTPRFRDCPPVLFTSGLPLGVWLRWPVSDRTPGFAKSPTEAVLGRLRPRADGRTGHLSGRATPAPQAVPDQHPISAPGTHPDRPPGTRAPPGSGTGRRADAGRKTTPTRTSSGIPRRRSGPAVATGAHKLACKSQRVPLRFCPSVRSWLEAWRGVSQPRQGPGGARHYPGPVFSALGPYRAGGRAIRVVGRTPRDQGQVETQRVDQVEQAPTAQLMFAP